MIPATHIHMPRRSEQALRNVAMGASLSLMNIALTPSSEEERESMVVMGGLSTSG